MRCHWNWHKHKSKCAKSLPLSRGCIHNTTRGTRKKIPLHIHTSHRDKGGSHKERKLIEEKFQQRQFRMQSSWFSMCVRWLILVESAAPHSAVENSSRSQSTHTHTLLQLIARRAVWLNKFAAHSLGRWGSWIYDFADLSAVAGRGRCI